MAASATFALKAGVWFRRGRLLIGSPDSLGTACPLSGRNSTYRPVQISATGSIVRRGKREVRASFYIAEAALPAAGGAVVVKSAKEWLDEAWKLWPKKPYKKTTRHPGGIHGKKGGET